ncbi:MAG: YfiR/HmsC family protein [Bacteroidales bacterium]|jgi:serine phosphatase RsbU (regulator of sigma subunit)|nr:YfiR/HmsC family protein [Bacteroidales bacterium]
MKKLLLSLAVLFIPLAFQFMKAQDQEELDDNTRATLILDIAKYVEYDESFDKLEEFSITILDTDDSFYWPLERMAGERQFVQGKPLQIYLAPRVNMLKETQVVYVNSKNEFKIKELLNQIEGWNTLVISEGYPFKESMINFLVVDGQPRFEANEELMNEHGLLVDELFLAQAIKTRADWEVLYEVTDVELQEEKEVTRQQKIVIAEQDSMIAVQIETLRVLGAEIKEKQKELEQKIKTLFSTEKEISGKDQEIARKESEIFAQKQMISMVQSELEEKATVLEKTNQNLKESEEELVVSALKIKANEEKIAIQLEAIQKQKLVIGAAIIALFLLLGLAYFIFVNYKNKKKANVLLEEKNIKITAQKNEIEQQKDVAEMQRDQIAYQKKHITDSIHYAQRIQRAILPSLELFSDEIEHFVLYKPRDIVSGDFYWVDKVKNKQIIIAADCTGHGVPGAFMSMLGVSFLNEIILNRHILEPDAILNSLRQMIIQSLSQGDLGSGVKDGMDMTVTIIDYDKDKLYYAGANNPLYHVRNGELTHYKADKMPVAIYEYMEDFNMITLDLQKGDTFYTFSDGYVDQFGGPKQKKFMSKNFKATILELQDMEMIEQGKKLDEIFEAYRAEIEQVDDVVVIGVRY